MTAITARRRAAEVQVYVSNRYYSYAIVGVYEYEDSGFTTESDDDVYTSLYMPLEAWHSVIRNRFHGRLFPADHRDGLRRGFRQPLHGAGKLV